jgi:signal transduction histidine kinase
MELKTDERHPGAAAVRGAVPIQPGPEPRRSGDYPAASADTLARTAASGARPPGRPVGAPNDTAFRRSLAALAGRDIRAWLFPLAVAAIIGIGVGVLDAGLPGGSARAGTIAMLVAAAMLSVVALSHRIRDLRLVVPALVGVGLCGAGLDLQADGPGYIAACVALVGLALRTPRRIAVLAGFPVVAAISAEETYQSPNPATTTLTVLFASGLVFAIAAFAAVNLDARHQAEALLAQEAATSEARQRAAALAERSRLARDLHDVLAHSLSALAVQLEATRMTAIGAGAGKTLVDQLASARKLTRIGMLEAHRALELLREGEACDPAGLPRLVSEASAMLGIPATLEVQGVPGPLNGEAGLTLYRVVQEALTNIAKHAGRGARVTVRLVWAPGSVEVSIVDRGGDGVGAALPSSGCGLTGMVERVTLADGRLRAGPSEGGFTVHLWLPVSPPVQERAR